MFERYTEKVSGEKAKPTPENLRIISELREQFDRMTMRLKPELEPAVSYNLRAENPQ